MFECHSRCTSVVIGEGPQPVHVIRHTQCMRGEVGPMDDTPVKNSAPHKLEEVALKGDHYIIYVIGHVTYTGRSYTLLCISGTLFARLKVILGCSRYSHILLQCKNHTVTERLKVTHIQTHVMDHYSSI
ncbi:hypothetical protein GDO81_022867 [Engystomops pustulosus]|uniref:Recombination activating protein 2 n=1 Tax=Engystomops pustulosus TaxID=76066 RepID=A0AAV6YNU7_ENGPU|nr:hypothetical protein GDO81_022867 [Engystomops pustulosus]